MTSEQLWEWMAYNELKPFTQSHEDHRIALLAEVVGKSAGLKLRNGDSLTASTFLDILHGHMTAVEQTQSVEQMTMYLNSWFAGSNAMFAEEAAQRGR